ncbi:MAG: hypothetical protein ACRDT4_09755 [Micromonosporaceae bacterium]
MPDLDPELVQLAHTYFQQHVLDESVRHLCVYLRPYPCPNRTWAIGYLVTAGRLVLPPDASGLVGRGDLSPALGG